VEVDVSSPSGGCPAIVESERFYRPVKLAPRPYSISFSHNLRATFGVSLDSSNLAGDRCSRRWTRIDDEGVDPVHIVQVASHAEAQRVGETKSRCGHAA